MELHVALSDDSEEAMISDSSVKPSETFLPSPNKRSWGAQRTKATGRKRVEIKTPPIFRETIPMANSRSTDSKSVFTHRSGDSTVQMSNRKSDISRPSSPNSGLSTVVASNRKEKKRAISPTNTVWSVLTDRTPSMHSIDEASPRMQFEEIHIVKKSICPKDPPAPSEKPMKYTAEEEILLDKMCKVNIPTGDSEEARPSGSQRTQPELSTAAEQLLMDGRMAEIEEAESTVGTASNSDWSIDSNQYSSSKYAYAGYGSGPPPGKKRHKGKKELRELTPPECQILTGESWKIKLYWLLRLSFTLACGLCVLGGMIYSYKIGLRLLEAESGRFAFGVYGAGLLIYLSIQAIFASLENKRFKKAAPPEDYENLAPKTIALQISAFQEDPHYFRECLKGAMELKYPRDRLKIICCIDGNEADSVYMAQIFNDVVRECGEDPAFFRWDYNFHELPHGLNDSDNGVSTLKECVEMNQFVCLMQKWGGKREVMYTAFKALKGHADYVQVCDSDTQLDSRAMLELAWVLDSQPNTGAVGGDVQIWNSGDSFISFLSSLRYWMAFNIERACQSYFGCVSCISGPIGLYRMSLIDKIVDLWSDQKFLGDVCTFGDDRHLTNRILQMGFSTKYTSRSVCKTETPSTYLRWLSQQIRWTKSYYREWMFNSMWWHKHHLWMACEAIFSGAFPFFIMYTILAITWSGELWALIHLLVIIQLIGLLKGLVACVVRRDIVMIFMSLYSSLYVTSLLPSKLFAILTIAKKSWGTSGRKNLLTNYNPLIPVTVWVLAIAGGLIYSAVVNDYMKKGELMYLSIGGGVYAGYWILMVILWKVLLQKHQKTKAMIVSESIAGSSLRSGRSLKSLSSLGSLTMKEGVLEVEDNVDGNGHEAKAILASLRDIEHGRLLPNPYPNKNISSSFGAPPGLDEAASLRISASLSSNGGPISPSASSVYSYDNFVDDFRRSERDSPTGGEKNKKDRNIEVIAL